MRTQNTTTTSLIPVMFALFIIMLVLRGWLVMLMWNYIITDLVAASDMSFAQGFLTALFIGCFVGSGVRITSASDK